MISDHLKNNLIIKSLFKKYISFSRIAASIDLLRFDKPFYSACKESENVIMSKTVESVYKFHGDTNVHDSPNMEREGEVNRIQKPSKLRIIAFKICKPIQNFGKHVKNSNFSSIRANPGNITVLAC